MPGYKHPCIYCDQLVPPEAQFCPFCGKVKPAGPLRCPRCQSPIEKGWFACSACGLKLETECPECKKRTFLGDYCQYCDASLTITCPNKKCATIQSVIRETCIKCGKPLKSK